MIDYPNDYTFSVVFKRTVSPLTVPLMNFGITFTTSFTQTNGTSLFFLVPPHPPMLSREIYKISYRRLSVLIKDTLRTPHLNFNY